MYRCPQCGSSYDRKVEFISHQQSHTDSGIKLELGTCLSKSNSGATDNVVETKMAFMSEKLSDLKVEKVVMRSWEQDGEMKGCYSYKNTNSGTEEQSGKKENAGKEHHEDIGDWQSVKEQSQESGLRLESFVKLENQSGSEAEFYQYGPNANGNSKLENRQGLILRIKDESPRNFQPDVILAADHERIGQSNCSYFKTAEVNVSQRGNSSLQIKDGLHERDISSSVEKSYKDDIRESCAQKSDVGNYDMMQIEEAENRGGNTFNENEFKDSSTRVLTEEDGNVEILRKSSLTEGGLKTEISDSVIVKEEEQEKETFYELPRRKKKIKGLRAKQEGERKKHKRKKDKREKDGKVWKWNAVASSGWEQEEGNNSNQTLKSDTAACEDDFTQKSEIPTASIPKAQKGQVNENVKSILRTEVHKQKPTNIFKELRVDGFTCILCNTRLDRREHMVRHIDNHGRGVYLHCWLCPVIRFCRASLKKHEKTHRGADNSYHCSLCSFSHASPKQLKIHSFSHEKINAFYCTDCSYATHWQENLKHHIQVNHTKVKTFLCSDCGKAFYCKAMLKRHALSHEEPLVCQVCGYFTHMRNTFNIHLIIHSQNKPYACDRCPFRTKRAWHLNRHKLVHETRKRYQCPRCNFSANQASTIKTHLYRHTGEFPFACRLCSYTCRQSSSLKTHLKVRHQECLYQCELCGFSTNRLRELRGHKMSHSEFKL